MVVRFAGLIGSVGYIGCGRPQEAAGLDFIPARVALRAQGKVQAAPLCGPGQSTSNAAMHAESNPPVYPSAQSGMQSYGIIVLSSEPEEIP